MAYGRKLLAVAAILMLSGCVSGLKYGDVRHSELSAGTLCNPASRAATDTQADAPESSDKPFFAVTSRLPNCTGPSPKLTSFRADKTRYLRFNLGPPLKPSRKAKPSVLFDFQAETSWWDDLGQAAQKNDGRILLYVHGYRETFNRSSRDAAQMAQLSNFNGPIVQYSWPSQGKLLGYTVDQTSVEWDARNFRRFLRRLAEKPWAKDIVLVSHSLGARLLIPGIRYVDRSATRKNANNISQIILASPDSDRQQFERDAGRIIMSPQRVKAGRRMTIYVSNEDKALGVARTVHGYPRLGRPFCFDPFMAQELTSRGLPERCYPVWLGAQQISAKSGIKIVDTTDVSFGNGHSNHLRSAAACLDFAATLQGQPTDRIATHLPHVFRLKGYEKGEKPAHDSTCKK